MARPTPADALDAALEAALAALPARLRALGGDDADCLAVARAAALERAGSTRVSPEDVVARMALEDLYLSRACVAGNDAAIRLFLQLHGARIAALCQRFAPSAALAEEATQELLATLFVACGPGDRQSPRLASFRGLGSLAGWLRVIAHRVVVDMLRGAGTRPTATDGSQERLRDLEADVRPTDEALAAGDATRRLVICLRAALDTLEPQERDLLGMHYRQCLVYREMGERLGVDLSTAYRRLQAVHTRVWRAFVERARRDLGMSEGDLRDLLGELSGQFHLGEVLPMLVFCAWLLHTTAGVAT